MNKPETLAAQGLGRVTETYREIVPPIHVATTYERSADGSYPGGRVYSRADNPGYDQAEALIAALERAREVGGAVAVDSTVATPMLTRPLELGASIVMHSATKYLNGHSDVIAGVLATREADELWERIRYVRGGGGAVLGPFEAWLLLRGMRTLHLRVAAACANALAIAPASRGTVRRAPRTWCACRSASSTSTTSPATSSRRWVRRPMAGSDPEIGNAPGG